MDGEISDLESELAQKEEALHTLQEQILASLQQNAKQNKQLQEAQNSASEQEKRNKELEEQY